MKNPKEGADNKLVCFLHPKGTNGVLVELCQSIRRRLGNGCLPNYHRHCRFSHSRHISTLAGNGSAITLTILTEVLGLPGNIANGTNRSGIVAQSTAPYYFRTLRGGKFNLKEVGGISFTTFIGAIAGALVAIYVSNEAFRKILRIHDGFYAVCHSF
ncbi:MAG: hypothetical protein R2769_10630 [Saprospiraceae bacterium]